jgi:hypothetical protein
MIASGAPCWVGPTGRVSKQGRDGWAGPTAADLHEHEAALVGVRARGRVNGHHVLVARVEGTAQRSGTSGLATREVAQRVKAREAFDLHHVQLRDLVTELFHRSERVAEVEDSLSRPGGGEGRGGHSSTPNRLGSKTRRSPCPRGCP